MNKIYETDRLVLKTLDNSVQEAKMVIDFYLRNKEHLMEWEPIRNEDFYQLDTKIEALNKDKEVMEDNRGLRLWIFKKEEKDSERIIGTIGLSNIILGAFRSCHLGYAMDKDELNKGFITEAIKKVIDIAFNEYELHRIEANIMPKNKASLRVTQKLGFTNEGISKKYLKINGKWEDHIHMVLLNEELE